MFEGSFLGDGSRIQDDTVMECGVCWWVYDPAEGDDVWHIAPGTPFARLPDHWRCPHCDALPGQFMTLKVGRAEGERPQRTAGQQTVAEKSALLLAAYENAGSAMRPLPVYNSALLVEVAAIRRYEEGLVATVVTPWCMNLVLLTDEVKAGREGSYRPVTFPSGQYEFVAGFLENLGKIETCSLFSPMEMFADHATAVEVARESLKVLFQPFKPEQKEPKPLSRRDFLRPGSRGAGTQVGVGEA
ncbi:MAG: [NiFe]-hydrogenase assembly chaperone HybE [Pseudomonadota bacterium]